MKSKEEMNTPKEETKVMNKKLKKLTEDDLAKVSGGGGIVTCNVCNGTGYINNTPCRYCKGSGGIYDPNYVGPSRPDVGIDLGNLEELVKQYLAENSK